MIIVIPTKDVGEKSFVSDQLGRTKFFYVYDTEAASGRVFNNISKNENHGAGVKTVEFLLNRDADILITPRVGKKALDLLLETNVKIYQSNAKIAKENIKDFLNEDLEELY